MIIKEFFHWIYWKYRYMYFVWRSIKHYDVPWWTKIALLWDELLRRKSE